MEILWKCDGNFHADRLEQNKVALLRRSSVCSRTFLFDLCIAFAFLLIYSVPGLKFWLNGTQPYCQISSFSCFTGKQTAYELPSTYKIFAI